MPVYHEMNYISLIKFSDIEDYVEENGLESLLGEIKDFEGKPLLTSEQIEYAWELLQERYAYSNMRYTDIMAALLAIRRVSRFAIPALIEKQRLYSEIYNTSLEKLRKERQNLRNLVEKPNIVRDNNDKVPIADLSTVQETITSITGTIDEMTDKWRMTNRNYIKEFYDEYNQLFSKIITDTDNVILYPQEEQ